MEIPSFQDCMFPLLRLAVGGQQHTLQEVTDAIAEHFQLSQEKRNQRRESGVNILYNRVAWARTYLKQANLLTYPVRGSLQITDEGKKVVESGVQNIDIKYLKRIPAYAEFQKGKKELSDSGPNPDILEELLEEFAEVADEWFAKCSFVTEFNQFIQDFFRPEKLQIAEWPDFQTLGNKLHSFNSVALAKSNAFGRPNYPIEKYRESFYFLAHGPGGIEERMRAFMGDKVAYASKFLGNSVVSELVGQLFADRFVFMNRRDIEAAEYLGINLEYERGDDFPTRFTKFNAALAPLFNAYLQVVGIRTGAPIGLEVDQFLSWLYETKISVSSDPLPPEGKQIWVFAPGPRAKFWDECRDGSIVVYGADLLGPLDAYGSKEEILQRLKEVYPKDTEPTNDALAAWEFSRVMKEGDLVIAKKGNRTIVGVGIVIGPYRHDPGRMEYPNVRDVKWTQTQEGDWILPPDVGSFATKTLTNITRYRDFVAKLLDVVGPGAVHHFWLDFAPDGWSVSECPVGAEKNYTIHSDEGNNNQIYACFQAVKPGDLVIGFETSPVQKVTTILEITQGIHMDEDERECECISFKVLHQLKHPRSLQELREIRSLEDCEPVVGQHQGSLFQLTMAEYEAIREKGEVSESEIFTIEDALDGLFVEKATFCDWLKQWRSEKNLILEGAPGVGKTFVANRLAYALMQEVDKERVAHVQFHQSYGYEDFVQGIKPIRVKDGELTRTAFDLRNGVFYEFCQRAKRDPLRRPHAFIIDEINRGNLSRILGELLMLIENDKRGEEHALRLAYQEEGQTFFVPENVYILGMMNTADRSLAVVDYALRRRFRFVTIRPAINTQAFHEFLTKKCNDEQLAVQIIEKVKRINEAISENTAILGPGYCIGHSYFCKIKTLADYHEVIDFQIAPLINEYWFDKPQEAKKRIEELKLTYDPDTDSEHILPA